MILDWNLIIVALIGGIPPTIIASIALIKVIRTHDLVNSRMSELLRLARAEATADEKKAEKGRQDAKGET